MDQGSNVPFYHRVLQSLCGDNLSLNGVLIAVDVLVKDSELQDDNEKSRNIIFQMAG